MEINILAFGIVKEIVGNAAFRMDVSNSATVGELLSTLKGSYPRLKELKSLAVAINGVYAPSDTVVGQHDEIALIPPVSGG